MDKFFSYQNDILFIDDVSLPNILSSGVKTPFYCYSLSSIKNNYSLFHNNLKELNPLICYAIKANNNANIIKTLASLGAGADCVSEGEIRKAIKYGIKPEKIILSGVGKTDEEIAYAIDIGIKQFNVESKEELEIINEIAKNKGKVVDIAIRVNPNVDAVTIDKISTGRKGDKFGIDLDYVDNVCNIIKKLDHISLVGIATHIGSQITDFSPFRKAFKVIIDLAIRLRNEGFNIKLIDFGGGIGINYNYSNMIEINLSEYGGIVKNEVARINDVQVVFEPGRFLVGNAGILVSKVILIKETDHKRFVILDAAMNDLMRPALYSAYHEIVPIKRQANALLADYDVVGPVCETTDIFAKNRKLPILQKNDVVAFMSSGAYGSVMSNEYNIRPITAELVVEKSNFAISKENINYEEMFAKDKLVNWLT